MTDSQNVAFAGLFNTFLTYLTEHQIYGHPQIVKFRSRGIALKKLMDEKNLPDFNDKNALELVQIVKHTPRHWLMNTINRLAEFQATGKVIRTRLFRKKRKIEFEGAFANDITAFIETERNKSTPIYQVQFFENHLSYFNVFCRENSLSDFSLAAVIEFITNYNFSYKNQPLHAIRALRAFTKFLYQEKKITRDFSTSFPSFRHIKQPKLPTVYTQEETIKILESIDRKSPKGKRDFAMLLLIAVSGLRPSDVAMLTISDIDWENDVIKFRQQKTEKLNELPLLLVVKGAIMEYLEFGRHPCSLPFIFLTKKEPYRNVTSASISNRMRATIRKSGIEVGTRIMGPRAFRSSVASRIQNTGHSIYVTSGILGNNPETALKHYIRVSTDSLYRCSLDVPIVNEKFYSQNIFIV